MAQVILQDEEGGGQNLPQTPIPPDLQQPQSPAPTVPTLPGTRQGTGPFFSGKYAPPGFSRRKWYNPSHKTPKYEVGRLLQRYGLNLNEAFPEIQRLFPGAKRVGADKVDFGGDIGLVDLIHNVGSPNQALRWGVTGASGGSGGGSGSGGPYDADYISSYAGQFTDPLTAAYEKLLSGQTDLYMSQQQRMQQEAAEKEAVRAETDAAVKRLMEYMNSRVSELQQPAYTGRELEILRTQMLDPIERDRTASRQRALGNVGSRGFDPTSGLAQGMFNEVDFGFDQMRAQAQGDIAYRQIAEERSRAQEAQELLQYLAQLPQAAAMGDMNFLSYLDSLINKPGQQALATSAMLADLPVQRTELAMQALGLGGSPQGSAQSAMSLLQNTQMQQQLQEQQLADFWAGLGMSFGDF